MTVTQPTDYTADPLGLTAGPGQTVKPSNERRSGLRSFWQPPRPASFSSRPTSSPPPRGKTRSSPMRATLSQGFLWEQPRRHRHRPPDGFWPTSSTSLSAPDISRSGTSGVNRCDP